MTDGPLQLLITNARVATGDPVRYNIGILGGVIVSMTSAEVSVPAARVVDAAGRWVIPGAIDTHAHIKSRRSTATCPASATTTTSPSKPAAPSQAAARPRSITSTGPTNSCPHTAARWPMRRHSRG
jgi:predicted amidohydrolase YtcJ